MSVAATRIAPTIGTLTLADCTGCGLSGNISPTSGFVLGYNPAQATHGGKCKGEAPNCQTDVTCKPGATNYWVENLLGGSGVWLQQLTAIGQPAGGRIYIPDGKRSTLIGIPETWPAMNCGDPTKAVARIYSAQTGGNHIADVLVNCAPCL